MGVKRDCYFFGESNVGPMNVPICGNGGSFSSMMFSCEGCKNYIRKSEVTEFVRVLLKFRETSNKAAEAPEPSFEKAAKKAGNAIRRIAQALNQGSQIKGSVDEETEEQMESPEESDDGTVRCKDCIYYREEDELPHITPFMECARPNPEDPEWHLKYHFKSDNDTCPHGVRKKKEGEDSQ